MTPEDRFIWALVTTRFVTMNISRTQSYRNLVAEKSDLRTKIDALSLFMSGTSWDDLTPHHRSLITIQRETMRAYERTLQARIDDLADMQKGIDARGEDSSS